MATTSRFAEVASLAGDPARAAMLHAMMDGRALTPTELAGVAGVTPQTASGHLVRMKEAGLIVVHAQRRHRYYALSSPEVARMMESIMAVASLPENLSRPVVTGPKDRALRAARTCYDHLAGNLGVQIADALVERGFAILQTDGGSLTAAGTDFLESLGIDLSPSTIAKGHGRRVFCRPCLDWSERRPHLAGTVGAAICTHGFDEGWIRRIAGTRAVAVTRKGEAAFREHFGFTLQSP